MKATINDEIVSIAQSYLGQEEIRGNKGFKQEDFELKMKAMGWQMDQAWCAYFAELVWKEAYQQWDATLFSRLDKLFSAGAVATYNNFKKAKDFMCNQVPKPGALVVWQSYVSGAPHWSGHVGIVETASVNKGIFTAIEGNTNDNGEREGFEVARKNRTINFIKKQNGLVLLGFVHPKIV